MHVCVCVCERERERERERYHSSWVVNREEFLVVCFVCLSSNLSFDPKCIFMTACYLSLYFQNPDFNIEYPSNVL